MTLHVAVPTPPTLPYYSDVVLWDDSDAAEAWHIFISECVVIALLCFLADVRDGAVGVA